MKKRSVSIRGHRTSFSLEDEFWNELKAIAARRKISLAQLVTQVDLRRGEDENLSSALRLFLLRDLKAKLSTAEQSKAGD
ncbi:MAG: ribbon-helix-helix domain-containing protein [Rhizobiaceae bacterium]|nr:ribbon-helix-helix domain-containing protein [Hyphomicrobiales bacterium]NRB30775.1 ribbon-helix-helix domain-containing protein [Rhizobiaceae bacterium]